MKMKQSLKSISKSNSARHNKIINHNLLGFILGIQSRFVMVCMTVFLLNSYAEILMPSMMVLGGRAFGSD